MNIIDLFQFTAKPPPFAKSTAPFWSDPHISKQMLDAHLDPTRDQASRKPESIVESVRWIVSHLKLTSGSRILDLGCGPGLYCVEFARLNLEVVGVDLNPRSVDHGRMLASAKGLPVRFLLVDYLTAELPCGFDLITLIFWDFGVLSEKDRRVLLRKVLHALKPGGHLVLDVTTPALEREECRSWSILGGGFWRPVPYLELRETFCYPCLDLFLTQYTILDDQGTQVYRLWDQSYTPDSLRNLLSASGFECPQLFEDVRGNQYTDASESLAIVASKPRGAFT